MTYTIAKYNHAHKKAKFVGTVKIGSLVINMYWSQEEGLLYGVEGANYKTGYNVPELIAYSSKELLDLMLEAGDSDIYILGSVLTCWEQYGPDEADAVKRVRYSTEAPARGSRGRTVARTPKPTPEVSLEYRINLLHSFVDDLPKQNIPSQKIVRCRTNIAKLKNLIKELMELAKSPTETTTPEE